MLTLSDAFLTALSDRYTVERELGRGGMATVFLARDLRHDRHVALKLLDPELGAIIGVERFLSEIRVTAHLQHPNLLPLFDSGSADGMLFYVMPYVEGESLRARLDRETQLPVDDALRIALSIAGALDFAHSRGVVHRDLKPDNVLLQHGEAIIADFGIALAVSNAAGARVTQTGLSLGTPQYMSPEQATGDREIDGRSDLYSLAALLYEMLGGEAPHSGANAQAIIAKLMTEEPRRLRMLRRTVPPHVEAAVHRGLQKLPADRWSSAREFADALRGARPVELLPGGPRTIGGRPLMIGVAALAAAAIIAAGVEAVMLRRATSTPASEVTLRFPLVTPDSERFVPTTPAIPFAISPDNRRVAYVGYGPNGRRVYVRGLDDMQSRALPGLENSLQPTFSPDGKWVAAVVDNRIVKTPVDGGAVTTLRRLDGISNAGLTWVDRDTLIASDGGRLEAVPADGGAAMVLSHPDSTHGELQQWGPRVINRRYVAYISLGATGTATNRLGILDRKTGRATITSIHATTAIGMMDDHLLWVTAAGAVMAAVIDGNGAPGPSTRVLEDVLVRPGGAAKAALSPNGSLIYQRGVVGLRMLLVDEHGVATPFGTDAQPFAHPRWSPDGSRIAVSVAHPGGEDIWLVDARTKSMSKFTDGVGINDNPAWSGDSKRVVYRRIDSSGTRIESAAVDGGPAGTLLPAGSDPYSAVPSHDGAWFAYRTADQSKSFRDLFVMPASGGAARPFAIGPGSQADPSFSPDGRWIAYMSDESGRSEIYVKSFPEIGSAIQVSHRGGSEPVWSHDGHTLYYREGQTLVAATLGGSPFGVVGVRPLFAGAFVADPGQHTYDIAPDDKHFLMMTSVDRQAETIVIYNWAAELRKMWRRER